VPEEVIEGLRSIVELSFCLGSHFNEAEEDVKKRLIKVKEEIRGRFFLFSESNEGQFDFSGTRIAEYTMLIIAGATTSYA
jgi:hypothetical protein